MTSHAQPLTVAGIDYSSRPDMPGARFFRCEALRCTLTTTSCASRWRQAADVSIENRTACTGCSTGSGHAGQPVQYRSAIFGVPFCPRARRGGERIINNRLGVSAYNRQREFVTGKNSKGMPPRIRLAPRRIGVVIGYDEAEPQYIEIGDDLTADGLELVIQTLRVMPGRLAFCAPRGGDAIGFAELARQFSAKPKRLSGGDLLARDIVRNHARRHRSELGSH